MKLTPHQKEIVKEIISGRVYDIPTYIRTFNKGKKQQYSKDELRANFEASENGQTYLFKKIGGTIYTETYSSTGEVIDASPVSNKFTHELNENPISTPMPAQLDMKIDSEVVEFSGHKYRFDFLQNGYLVADNFADIIDFIALWAFLRREALVLDVSKPVTSEDLSIFFEQKQQPLKQDNAPLWNAHHTIDDSATQNNLPTIYTHFTVTKKTQGYITNKWQANHEHLVMCEEFVDKKIIATSTLQVYRQSKFRTFEEVSQRRNLVAAWIAIGISFISVIIGNIFPLFNRAEEKYLHDINRQVTAIREEVQSKPSTQDVLDELSSINQSLADIMEQHEVTSLSDAIKELSEQIDVINQRLTTPTDPTQ